MILFLSGTAREGGQGADVGRVGSAPLRKYLEALEIIMCIQRDTVRSSWGAGTVHDSSTVPSKPYMLATLAWPALCIHSDTVVGPNLGLSL